jgi:hypothetical protein
MSRVERLDEKDQEERRARQRGERGERSSQPIDRTPGKAEGDEQTVEEALRNQERKS